MVVLHISIHGFENILIGLAEEEVAGILDRCLDLTFPKRFPKNLLTQVVESRSIVLATSVAEVFGEYFRLCAIDRAEIVLRIGGRHHDIGNLFFLQTFDLGTIVFVPFRTHAEA